MSRHVTVFLHYFVTYSFLHHLNIVIRFNAQLRLAQQWQRSIILIHDDLNELDTIRIRKRFIIQQCVQLFLRAHSVRPGLW